MADAAPDPALSCPRCGGSFEPGFTVDAVYGTVVQQQKWVAGQPTPSFWHGLNLPSEGNRIPITTYRCTGCGYLESYAGAPPEGPRRH